MLYPHMNIVALVPARAGSKRIPGKNTKLLGGKPLIQWTIEAAKESGIFSDIAISSDDIVPMDFDSVLLIPRPDELATDNSPDICWVRHALGRVECDAFAILRPTSPFRTADTIRRAYHEFLRGGHDSIRAVQRVKEHPGKMWRLRTSDELMTPIMDGQHADGTPWHSSPTQSLPPIYVQNSSLEMAMTRNVTDGGTISGRKIRPFFTWGMEGFSIDYPDDWDRAERHASALLARVP